MNYKTELEFAKNVARQAGEIMLRYFDGDMQTETKQDGTPVTIADTLINKLVIEEVAKNFPADGVIGEEESTAEYGLGRTWFCDPIDGTKAYTWGVPTSMFSLGLVQNGRPKMGVVFDPYLNKMYFAVEGQGSFCNDSPLRVSDSTLADGLVYITSSYEELLKSKPVSELAAQGIKLAMFSGAIYKASLVAKGRGVAYFEALVNAYDMAAAELIVSEAGGKVTSLKGEVLDYSKPFRGALVSNAIVHEQMLEIFNK
jgi:fructose-1,6-bisphosphatase/inositol monophosphatase family enzyme